MTRRPARGFTLIELLVAILVLSTLARLAIPYSQRFERNARAAQIMRTVTIVRQAAEEYYANQGTYPCSPDVGAVPPELAGYVPRDLVFSGKGWKLYVYGESSGAESSGDDAYSYFYVFLQIPDASLGRVVYNDVTRKLGAMSYYFPPNQYSFLNFQFGGHDGS